MMEPLCEKNSQNGGVNVGRRSIPFEVLKGQNKKSRRTNAELKTREDAEKSVVTGSVIKMYTRVAADPEAKKIFTRTFNLLKAIKKHDALGEPILNRYALLTSECVALEKQRDMFAKSMEKLEKSYEENPDSFNESSTVELFKVLSTAAKTLVAFDKQVQAKRKMLFEIEKEMLMTVAAQLRSIPKKPQKPDTSQGGFAAFSQQNQGTIRDVQF